MLRSSLLGQEADQGAFMMGAVSVGEKLCCPGVCAENSLMGMGDSMLQACKAADRLAGTTLLDCRAARGLAGSSTGVSKTVPTGSSIGKVTESSPPNTSSGERGEMVREGSTMKE